ncbi:MAG: ABC transporter ATP-binding protein [Bacteroidetes bacterium]|nr:ABC transporter ATP-binding protein [Bacteroidota bacterium]MBU1114280.1 ABC transporter ATP-binding protein [Bacteroidota bacterium]MBU1798017.1 ABC transporter ATP-binding protein [Bacteroidota bacterium]
MKHAFKIDGMEKSFQEFKLGPINLELEQGMVMGYIGPNGSGKTTTMHCMVGLVKPDLGEVEIFNRKNDSNKTNWKFDIGYVGDKHVFYENWSGMKNLEFLQQFYPNWDKQFESELIKRFEIPITKKAKELSSGNRVKLSLIGALAHRPKLLLLDEPTSGLDPVVRTELLDILFEVVESGERAIFYSTHILSDISRIADELTFINNGQIMLTTPKEDLTENWRRISFKLPEPKTTFINTQVIDVEGNNYKIISSNFNATLTELKNLRAENITESIMSIDEIAVQILKNNKT